MSRADTYLIKAPHAMLARWHEEAEKRGVPLAQLIREAVNREIERSKHERTRPV
jgi:hypothetical protein